MVGFSGPTRLYLYPYPIFITLSLPLRKITLPGGPLPYAGGPYPGANLYRVPRGATLPAPPQGRVQKFMTRVYPTVSVLLILLAFRTNESTLNASYII